MYKCKNKLLFSQETFSLTQAHTLLSSKHSVTFSNFVDTFLVRTVSKADLKSDTAVFCHTISLLFWSVSLAEGFINPYAMSKSSIFFNSSFFFFTVLYICRRTGTFLKRFVAKMVVPIKSYVEQNHKNLLNTCILLQEMANEKKKKTTRDVSIFKPHSFCPKSNDQLIRLS